MNNSFEYQIDNYGTIVHKINKYSLCYAKGTEQFDYQLFLWIDFTHQKEYILAKQLSIM